MLLIYQELIFQAKKMNKKRNRIYRQKARLICYVVIIIQSNITKVAFELTRYLTNFSVNHSKAANYYIRYLHASSF